jgi:hypothetical protein
MKRMKRSISTRPLPAVALLAGLFAIGCGEDFTVADMQMAGRIDGMAWTLADAETNAFLSAGSSNLFTNMYEHVLESPCQGIGTSSPRHLLLSVPKSPGSYALSVSLNATFVIEEGNQTQNLVATRGRLEVDEVTPTLVRGGAHIVLDNDNEVNGKLEIRVCPAP